MFFNLLETAVRLILFLSGLFFLIPILASVSPKSEHLEIQILEVILGVLNVIFLVLFLCNVVITSYTPFGRSVSSGDSFLTALTGYNTRIIVAIIGISLIYTKNAEESYTLQIDGQDSILNQTAYSLGEGEFFIDLILEDNVGVILRDNLFYAQNALLFGGAAFVLLWLFEFYVIGLFYNKQMGGSQWYVVRWYQRNPELLGLPARGPAMRNLVMFLFATGAGVIEVLNITRISSSTTYKEFFPCFVFIINCSVLAGGSLIGFLQNFIRRRLTPVLVVNVIMLLQICLHTSIYSIPLVFPNLNLTWVGYVFPAGIGITYLITFNINLLKIIPLEIAGVVEFVVVNLANDNINKFFRFVWSVSLVLGMVAMFFAYYAYLGDAFDFKFESGTFVSDITSITDDVEDKFDAVISDVNSFMASITPCTTTDTVFLSDPNEIIVRDSTGSITTYSAPTPAQIIAELQTIDYFDVCFVGSDWDTLPFADTRCNDPYASYLESESNQSAFSSGTLPVGVQTDTSFTDDEGQEVSFEVLKIDPQCFKTLCDAFTGIMAGLFATTLIPFAGTVAAIAAKAARIGWNISRIGQRLMKHARKMYAKRRKLSRFIKLLKKLSAIGNPSLKFNIAIVFMFIPTVVIGLFCILLAFFKRDISDSGKRSFLQQESARLQLLVIFLALSLFNIALFIGFFGFGLEGSRSLDMVSLMLKPLPDDLIIATVEYGLGMRYLRYTLIISFVSGLFFSVSLAFESVYSFFGSCCSRKKYAKVDIEDKPTPPPKKSLIISASYQPTTQLLNNNIISVVAALLFVIPVVYLATDCFNNDKCRWFNILAEQDDKLADIAEAVANSEVISESADIINGDVEASNDRSTERSCGIISLAVEPVYDALLDTLEGSFGPLIASLNALRTKSLDLLGAIKIDNIFASIDLNFPWSQAEYFVIFALPILYIIILLADVVLTITYMYTKRSAILPIVNNMETVLLAIALTGVQVNLVIFGVFSSFGDLDVPLFNLKISMGKLIEYGLYSSIFCLAASISIYFNRLIPLI